MKITRLRGAFLLSCGAFGIAAVLVGQSPRSTVPVLASYDPPPALKHDHSLHSHDNDGSMAVLDGSSPYGFSTLDKMVATSDAVIEGEILEVRQGPVLGDGSVDAPPPHGLIGFNHSVLRVDAVHFVRGNEALWTDRKLIISEIATESGQPAMLYGVPHNAVGERGFYFLRLVGVADPAPSNPGEELLVKTNMLNHQARYLIRPDGTLLGSDQTDPFVLQEQMRTPSEMRLAIEEAEQRFMAGEVLPEPRSGTPCPLPDGCPGDAPWIHVEVKALRVEPSTVQWICEATAVNDVAEVTRVTQCDIRDLDRDEWVVGQPAEASGPLAVSSNSEQVGLSQFRNIEACWDSVVLFKSGDTTRNDACKTLNL